MSRRRRDALAGQAALDEANTRIVVLEHELALANLTIQGARLRLTLAGHMHETCICGPCKWRRDHAEAIARAEPR